MHISILNSKGLFKLLLSRWCSTFLARGPMDSVQSISGTDLASDLDPVPRVVIKGPHLAMGVGRKRGSPATTQPHGWAGGIWPQSNHRGDRESGSTLTELWGQGIAQSHRGKGSWPSFNPPCKTLSLGILRVWEFHGRGWWQY